jgi:ADP-ribosyl-[dinitrogen reductase] hydrolase
MLYGALSAEPKEQVLNPSPELLDPANLRPKISALLGQSLVANQSRPPRAGGSIVAVLAAALWIFATTENISDGLLQAANLGGHSDAIAAAYGQLAGAHYGAHAIPAAWRNGLAHGALIAGFADRLFAHAQRHPIR